MKFHLAGLLIAALTITAWSQKPPAGWKVLSQANYTIQYPANWTLDQSGSQSLAFMIHTELTSLNDPFRENVDLIIQDLRGTTIYLNKYVKMSEEKLGTILNNFKIVESTRMNDHRGEFHKLIFTGDVQSISGSDANLKLKFEQYIWVKGIKAYVLTFHAEVNQFDTYKVEGEKILNSFKIK